MNSENRDVSVNTNKQGSNGEITIDIIRVFRFMGQKFRIYAFILAICILIGFSVPLLMFQFNNSNPSVYAQITFNYAGAEDALAPDGSKLDVTELASSYVLNRAMENAGIYNISYSSVVSNLGIEASLSDEAAQKLAVLNSVEDNSSIYNTVINEFEITHSNKYIITLKNGFGSADSSKPGVILTNKQLYNLLQHILDSYNEYFIEKYTNAVLPVNTLCTIDNTNLDYIELLDSSESFLDYLKNYCKNLSSLYPGYSSAEYGMSFANIVNLIETVENVDLNPVKADVFSKSVCRDPKNLVSKSNYQIEVYKHNLEEYKSKYDSVSKQIEEYKNSRVVLKNDETTVTESSTFTTVHYNNLVMQLVDYSELICSTEKNIAYYEDIIASFSNSKEGANADIADKIKTLGDKCTEIYSLVCDCAEDLFDTGFYRDNFMSTVAISGTADSLTSTLKNDLIGAAAGAFIGVCIWGVDALICEIKSNYPDTAKSKKEEESA